MKIAPPLITTRRWISVLWSIVLVALLAACTEELTEQDYLNRSQAHEEKGEINAAIIELKNALKKNQKNPESRFHLGELSLQTGNLVVAEKEFKKAQSLGMPQVRVQIPLAMALLGQQDFAGIIDAIDPSLEVNKEKQVAAQLLLGDAYLGLREITAARSIYDSLLKEEKHDVRVLAGMARVEIVSGNPQIAKDYLSHALTIEPDNLAALFIDGALKNQQQKYTESEQRFSHALKKIPADSLTMQMVTARSGLAEALLGQGKEKAAREHINALLVIVPNSPISNYLKGYADYQAGKLIEASEVLLQVLKVIPDHPPSLMLLGTVNYARGNFEQAATYLTRSLDKDDNNISVRKLLTATRLQLNQPEKALSVLSDGVQSVDDAQILLMSGMAHIASGDTARGLIELEGSVKSDPDRRELRLELAAGYIRAKQFDKALNLLNKLSPSTEGFRRESLLIRIYMIKKDVAKVESISANLIVQNPGNVTARNLAGAAYFSIGKESIAREQFLKAIELAPENAMTLINLGRLEIKKSAYVKAQEYFEKALQQSPQNATVMTLLAHALLGQENNSVVAIEWLEKARTADANAIEARISLIQHYLPKGRKDLALVIAQEAIRSAPKNPRAINALGIVQMNVGDYESAQENFEKTAELAPLSSDVFHNLARTYIAQQKIEKARQALLKSLELNPDHPLASSTLIVFEARQGHYQTALTIARQQQKRQPQQVSGYVLEGDVHILNSNPEAAVKVYQIAYQQKPSQAVVLKLFSAQRQAKVVGARDTVEQWLRDNPQDNRVKMALAMTHHEDGDAQQAESLYQAVIDAEPNTVEALNNLAWIYHLKGDKKSVELAQRAHELAPGVGAVTDTLGWILIEQGDVRKGVKILRQAIKESPDNPDIQYHLAAGLSKEDNKSEARQLLESALKTERFFESRSKAQELLETL